MIIGPLYRTRRRGPEPDAGPRCPVGRWCSALFVATWQSSHPADAKGRFLHDFSWAGYHNGEKPLPTSVPGVTVNAVTAHGADPSGKSDATAAIQAAIGAVEQAGGGVVMLPAGTYRVDGVLAVKGSGVVIRGAGPAKTTLHFTRHQSMAYKAHLTFSGKVSRGPHLLLAKDATRRQRTLALVSVAGLKKGDRVAVGWAITRAFVTAHGMSGLWKPVCDQWKAVFRRTVVAVNASASPPTVTLDIPLRYPALRRDKASVRKESGYLREGGLERLAVSNAVKWKDAWALNQVHAVMFNQTRDCWMRQVHTAPSPGATGWNALDKTPAVVNHLPAAKYGHWGSGVR